MSEPLYGVYGASGCGRGIMPLARQQMAAQGVDQERLVFVDDGDIDGRVNGHRVLKYAAFRAEAGRQGSPEEPLTIGEGAVVGMGAVVTSSVPAGATVVGNPAKLFLSA